MRPLLEGKAGAARPRHCQAMTETSFPADLSGFGEPFATAAPATGLGFKAIGLAATGLALAGVAVPLLPSTPFALVAAWAFARSSPRLQAWLDGHPRLGPMLAAWKDRRAIPRVAKAVAAVSLPTSWAAIWAVEPGVTVIGASGVGLAAVGAWILSRPN